jgi:hypothetical protein
MAVAVMLVAVVVLVVGIRATSHPKKSACVPTTYFDCPH